MPETLIESELFGHEKGSFTNAGETRAGLLETAGEGTIFLDEVETLSLTVQAKLFRVLQERVFRRVGGRRDLPLRARVTAATNQELEALVETNEFRRDLFYRLNVIPVNVPPLRERREDIAEIAAFLLNQRARELGTETFKITQAAMQLLVNHEWRGNVRELKNLVLYVTALGGSLIDIEDLPTPFQNENLKADKPRNENQLSLAEAEKQHILQTLKTTGGNRVQAAKLLGVDRRTLYNKLQNYSAGRKASRKNSFGGLFLIVYVLSASSITSVITFFSPLIIGLAMSPATGIAPTIDAPNPR